MNATCECMACHVTPPLTPHTWIVEELVRLVLEPIVVRAVFVPFLILVIIVLISTSQSTSEDCDLVAQLLPFSLNQLRAVVSVGDEGTGGGLYLFYLLLQQRGEVLTVEVFLRFKADTTQHRLNFLDK